MEQKLEKFIQHGLELLIELKEPFLKDWQELKNSQLPLVSVFDKMIRFGYHFLEEPSNVHSQTFIWALTSEWQKRFPLLVDEIEAVFLVNLVENLFHKRLSKKHNRTFLEHQAIQTFFSKLLDHALFSCHAPVEIEKWFQMIIKTNLLPVKWMAVVKKVEGQFIVDKVVGNEKENINQDIIPMCTHLKANQVEHIQMALSKLLFSESSHEHLISVSCLQDTLLLCSDLEIDLHQQDFMKRMYLRQLKMNQLENKIEWKDAALLFLQRLIHANNAESALKSVTMGLVDYLSFKRCAIFFYSPLENQAIGVSGHQINSTSIQQIKEEIEQLSFLQKYMKLLQNSQPFYLADAADMLPIKYVQEFRLKSLIVIPLFVPSQNKLLGIALLDQGEETFFRVTPETLTTLIKFGQYAGEFLFSYWEEILQLNENHRSILTKREKEVLQRMAAGDSINEAADKLNLSSYTVRDYISAIIQKLDSRNRTEAVVKAVKMKLIG